MRETGIVPATSRETACPVSQAFKTAPWRRSCNARIAGLACALALVWPAPVLSASDRPAQFMNTVAKQLVAAARSGSPHMLAGVIRSYADMPDIGLYSLGSYMNRLPKARRRSYYDGVARFMARYFMAQAKSYPPAKIEIFPPSSRAQWGYKVNSRITLTNGDTYALRWLVVQRGKGFKVRDVAVSVPLLGYQSMTPLQRKLFERYIDEKGGNVNALLAALGG